MTHESVDAAYRYLTGKREHIEMDWKSIKFYANLFK